MQFEIDNWLKTILFLVNGIHVSIQVVLFMGMSQIEKKWIIKCFLDVEIVLYACSSEQTDSVSKRKYFPNV